MPAHMSLIGRLAQDPETRTAGSTTVTTLVIPVDTGFGDRKVTTWWRASVWGARGEKAAEYLRKGSWVAVNGEASIREYDGKNGRGFSAEVNAASWSFVGNKSDNPAADGGGGGSTGRSYGSPSPAPAPAYQSGDVPF